MRLSADCTNDPEALAGPGPDTADERSPPDDDKTPADPSAPDVSFLKNEPSAALRSFFETIDRIERDCPVRSKISPGGGGKLDHLAAGPRL